MSPGRMLLGLVPVLACQIGHEPAETSPQQPYAQNATLVGKLPGSSRMQLSGYYQVTRVQSSAQYLDPVTVEHLDAIAPAANFYYFDPHTIISANPATTDTVQQQHDRVAEVLALGRARGMRAMAALGGYLFVQPNPTQYRFTLADCWRDPVDVAAQPCARWLRDAPFYRAHAADLIGAYAWDEPNGNGVSRADLERAVDILHRDLPGVPVMATYVLDGKLDAARTCRPHAEPWVANPHRRCPIGDFASSPYLVDRADCVVPANVASNLDWLGIDAYVLTSPAEVARYWTRPIRALSRAFPGKPILPAVESFNAWLREFASPAHDRLPDAEQQRWYYDAATRELTDVHLLGLFHFSWDYQDARCPAHVGSKFLPSAFRRQRAQRALHAGEPIATPHADAGNSRLVIADVTLDGTADLVIVVPGSPGQLHVLSGESGFGEYTMQRTLPAIGTAAVPLVGDVDGDGVPDLALVVPRGTRGRTELHVLDGASSHGDWSVQVETPLGDTTGFAYALADVDADGRADLAAIDRGDSSRATAMHVVSAASGYRAFHSQQRTLFGDTRGAHDFALVDANAGGAFDLAVIAKRSGGPELHVASGETGLTQFLAQLAIPLAPITAAEPTFLVDVNGDGRLDVATVRGRSPLAVDVALGGWDF